LSKNKWKKEPVYSLLRYIGIYEQMIQCLK